MICGVVESARVLLLIGSVATVLELVTTFSLVDDTLVVVLETAVAGFRVVSVELLDVV